MNKSHREMVYEFMVALAANPKVIDDGSSSLESHAQYVLSMAITLADRFESSLVEIGSE